MSLQIQSKFISDAAIDGDKIKLSTGQAIKLVKADGTTEVRLIELDEATGKVKVDGKEVALEADLLAEVAARGAADSALSTAVQALIQAEAEARVSADSALDARLDVLEGADTVVGSVAKAEKDAKAYADAKIADVLGTSSSVVATFASLSTMMSDSDAATGLITSLGAVRDTIQAVSDGLADEVTRATGAENALDARLDIIEGSVTTEGSVAKAEADAKAHADSAVYIEKTRAEDAEDALDTRLDTLEARLHRKMKFVLSAQDITNGYVELAHEAMANSVVASVGRLMIHEGASDDFTVSVVAGKTRMTFVGNLVAPSEEQLAAGDVLFVKYVNV